MGANVFVEGCSFNNVEGHRGPMYEVGDDVPGKLYIRQNTIKSTGCDRCKLRKDRVREWDDAEFKKLIPYALGRSSPSSKNKKEDESKNKKEDENKKKDEKESDKSKNKA